MKPTPAPHVSPRVGSIRAIGQVALACLVLYGCSGTDSSQRLELPARVAASIPEQPFENALGWSIQIEEASLSVDALWLFSGEALGASFAPSAPWWRGLLVKTAHAHPGHYDEGQVLAEMLSPARVDLASGAELAQSNGVTGQPGSGKLRFGGEAVRLHGHASPPDGDGPSRFFEALATRQDLGTSDATEVTGCPVSGGPLTPGKVIELRIDVPLWLDQVDFSGVELGSVSSPASLNGDARARQGFLRGLAKAGAYHFHILEDTL